MTLISSIKLQRCFGKDRSSWLFHTKERESQEIMNTALKQQDQHIIPIIPFGVVTCSFFLSGGMENIPTKSCHNNAFPFPSLPRNLKAANTLRPFVMQSFLKAKACLGQKSPARVLTSLWGGGRGTLRWELRGALNLMPT